MDYTEPLLELRAWDKCYSDSMRNKKPDIAVGAAMKIMRIGADLAEAAEKAIAVQRSEPAGRRS